MSAFVDDYDAVLFDLDGVLYLGPDPVPGAVDAVAALGARGVRTLYVTNNAARSDEVVAAHLSALGFAASVDDVMSSAQATQQVVRESLAAGSPVLVVGTANLVAHVEAAGMRPVTSADEAPVAVVIGYNPNLAWPELDEAAFALQRGARWIATNPDLTRPTDRGIVPGLGTMIAALHTATGRQPDVIVGKPYQPLMEAAVRRSGARRPVFVGDRIDTDIMGAHTIGIDSFMVFTGSNGVADLLTAPAHGRPDAIGWDVSSLLQPRRTASVEGSVARCGRATVTAVGGDATIDGPLADRDAQFDALWALAQLVWREQASADCAVVASLDLLA